MILVHIGSGLEIDGVVTVRSFGQRIEIDAGLAEEIIRVNAPLLPLVMFDEIGFTADELAKFGDVGTHAEAPAEFNAKTFAARLALHDLREKLRNGGTLKGDK